MYSVVSSEFSNLPASSYKSHDVLVCFYYFSFAVRCQVLYTISQPTPEWDGYEGRVSMEMLLEILPPPPSAGHERELLIAVCGPDAFSIWSGKTPIISEMGKAAVDLPTQPLVFALNDF